MPLALIFIGMVILIAGIRGKEKDLFAVLRNDFTGSDNFFVWVVAIIFIVAIGYVDKLRPLSNAFLGLTILVIILASYKGNKDLFSSFVMQIRQGTTGQTGSAGWTNNLTSSVDKYLSQFNSIGNEVNNVTKTVTQTGEIIG